MNLFFDHILSQQSDKDFNFVLVSACFEKDEEQYALENGWVPFMSWYDSNSLFSKQSFEKSQIIWVQVRSSRICVNDFSINKNQKRLLKNDLKFELKDSKDLDFEKIYNIYLAYCKYKDFGDVKSYTKFIERYKNDILKYLCYYDDGNLVAYCMVEFLGGQMYSHQFCWNYENPKLSLGIVSQIKEVELAKERNIDYVYIGGISENFGLYKTKFAGFEYWDGRRWCKNDAAIQTMLEKDSKIKTIEDLYLFTLEYIKIKEL
jgi:arginyl-tRNA--protein-N-Asp/Glu arginylyltransferase